MGTAMKRPHDPTSLNIPYLDVLSSLPDTSSVPSSEKASDVTFFFCPERIDPREPVIGSRKTMLPDFNPTTTMSFQHTKAPGPEWP